MLKVYCAYITLYTSFAKVGPCTNACPSVSIALIPFEAENLQYLIFSPFPVFRTCISYF